MAMQTRREPTEAEQLGIMYQIRQKYGVVADSDSYKLTHAPQYPDGATAMRSYIESRGGLYDKVLWFGMQLIVKEYLLQRLTQTQADNMIAWATEHMGGNITNDLKIALDAVVNELGGRLPIRIRTAPEGLLIPTKNVLAVIETTKEDRRFFSLVSYFETKLIRVWAPSTVATTSYYVRQTILKALERSADAPLAEIPFKLHDFGARGVSSGESAAFVGAGHLVSFMGSDTHLAMMAVEVAYACRMAAFSIPASEHSTTTTWGRNGEVKLVKRMFQAYGKKGAIFATVADSYDIIHFLRNITPQFKETLLSSEMAFWVVRPDSNDPIKMPVQCVIELEKVFGCTVNSKGYKVLNGVRVIQGDGISPPDVDKILDLLMSLGYSASNMAFGMGGGLLQKNNRDTQKFALKCCQIKVDGVWLDVYKEPSEYNDNWERIEKVSFKKSKRGNLELMYNPLTKEYATKHSENADQFGAEWNSILETTYEDGYIVREYTFDEVRHNAGTL